MKKYNIGFFHYIANFTDGVSLEMNKWKRVFEDMGHNVYLCAGEFGSADEVLIEEMYHHSPQAHLLFANTFKALIDYPNETVYREEMFRLSDTIEVKLGKFVEDKHINLIIPQNVWTVAANPAVAIALTRLMRKYNLLALAHNHDFYFERTDGFSLTCGTAAEIADIYLPPRDPLARHVVINSIAQRQLFERKGITSAIVPNVFDFDTPPWELDDYNRDFKEQIGLKENDICVLQATRIVTRKGIELAIDFVQALNAPEQRTRLKELGLYDGRPFKDDSRIVLVLAGYAKDDGTGRYKSLLAQKAQAAGIEALFIEDVVAESREIRSGKKIYSLWDTYVHADFVTYPSQWEGWGNQLLEAIRAKLPLMLFEYPVYQTDIKEKSLRVISLGSEISGRNQLGMVTVNPEIIQAAANQAVELLTDNSLRQNTVEHNFKVGKKHFSMDTLYIYLEQLLLSLETNWL